MDMKKDVVVGGSVGEKNEWEEFMPKQVDRVAVMSEMVVRKAWLDIYKMMGQSGASEKKQKMIRCAVYTYAYDNGTSRAGGWEKSMRLADGTSVKAAAVPMVVGKFEIRRFMRGNMKESTDYLRDSGIVEGDPMRLAIAAERGVGPAEAFACADWFENNPHLTPAQTDAHQKVATFNYERAKRARGGRTLEEVEATRDASVLHAAGPSRVEEERRVEF